MVKVDRFSLVQGTSMFVKAVNFILVYVKCLKYCLFTLQ